MRGIIGSLSMPDPGFSKPQFLFRAFSLLIALTLLVYAAGIRGDFMFDDIPNIESNIKVQIQSFGLSDLVQAWNSGVVGVFGRALSMLSFGMNHALFGLNPAAFKLVNLLIHLFNGVLIFYLVRMLLCSLENKNPNAISLWVAAIWLLHPINVTPVLLIVQRMTELASLFTLAGILAYMKLRLARSPGLLSRFAIGVSIPGFWTLGLLSKEIAILAPLYVVAIELFVLRNAPRVTQLPKLAINVVQWGIGAAVLALAFMVYSGHWIAYLGDYSVREFSLHERLWSEARVVWIYVKSILIPWPSDFYMFHDGFQISRGWFQPWTTFASVGALGITSIILMLYGRKAPLVGFGVAWFIVGHLLESSVVPLELFFEHRNYLPSMGLIIAFADVANRLCNAAAVRRKFLWLVTAGSICLFTVTIQTAQRAYAYGSLRGLYAWEIEHNPASYRALIGYALAVHEESLDRLKDDEGIRRTLQDYFSQAASLDPEQSYPWLAKIDMACRFDDPIDPLWAARLSSHFRGQRPYGERMNTMDLFAGAAISKKLCLDDSVVRSLFLDFLNNSKLSGKYKAITLVRYGEYDYVMTADKNGALTITNGVLDVSSEGLVRQMYANLLNKVGESDAAQQILRAIPIEERRF